MGIPEDWIACQIHHLGRVVSGGTPSTRIPEYWGDDIAWISPADLSGYTSKSIAHGAKSLSQAGLDNSSAQLMPKGSVLFSSRAPVGYVAIASNELATNQGFKSLVPAQGINSSFLYYYFRSIRTLANDRATGTTFKELSGKAFAKLPAVLAPLVEQRAIVAKIESLFSELDQGVAQLEALRTQLGRYRQSVLKAAFEGRLTAQWRDQRREQRLQEAEAHGETLPTADDLLARIHAEREVAYAARLAVWERAVAAWEAAGGKESGKKKPRKPAAPKDPPPLTTEELADLPELPEGWVWCRLGLATLGVEYGSAKKSRPEGEVPVIRMGNMQNGVIDWEDLVFTSDPEEIEQYRLQPDDVLFNRTNSPELVGKTVIYRGERTAIFAGYLVRVNQIATIAQAPFLTYFLNSHLAKQHGNRVKTDGVNQSNINGTKLAAYPLPYCDQDEQTAIVSEIDAHLSVVDEIEKVVATTITQAEALRQSILKKAFEGRLLSEDELAAVRADPAYEPAGQLLARIRESNAGPAPKKKTRRKRKAAEAKL